MAKKDMKLSNKSPLGQLLAGGTIKANRMGSDRGRYPFVELLEEGWIVREPTPDLGKQFGGIMRETKTMMIPTDESAQSYITRTHEMGHVALTPKVGLMELSEDSGIPPEVVNAFEDGRINGVLHRDIPRFTKIVNSRGFPIDVNVLRQQVSDTVERRKQMEERYGKGHHNTEAFLSDEEIRMTGACLMAAGEMFSAKKEDEWRAVGDACLMNAEQLDNVARLCHGLKEMSYEQMIEALKELGEFLLEPIEESEPDIGGTEGAEGDPDEGDPEEVEVGEVGEADPDADAEARETDGRMSGMGPGAPEGKDWKPEESGSNLKFKTIDGEKVDRPKLPAPSGRVAASFERVGKRVAAFDPNKTKVSNSKMFKGPMRPRVSDHTKSPSYAAAKIEKDIERRKLAEEYRRKNEEARKAAGLEGSVVSIMDHNFGVTEGEQAAVARRHGRMGCSLDPATYDKPEMAMLFPPLTEQIVAPMGQQRKARKHDRVGYMATPSRAHIDGKVYRRKMRVRRLEPAGAILLDCSGSMHPSSEQIRKCLEIAPYAVVAGYAGDDISKGSLALLARNRMSVSETQLSQTLREMGGGNSVDYPALEWLASQKGPRVWVSDAGICGSGTNELININLCFEICREYEIKRVWKLEMLVGMVDLQNNMQSAVGGVPSE